jgi:hypothetical protein
MTQPMITWRRAVDAMWRVMPRYARDPGSAAWWGL